MNSVSEVMDLNLGEAAKELDALRARLTDSDFNESEFATRLNGVLWHLRASWNGRHLSLNEAGALGLVEFDALGSSPIKLPGFSTQ